MAREAQCASAVGHHQAWATSGVEGVAADALHATVGEFDPRIDREWRPKPARPPHPSIEVRDFDGVLGRAECGSAIAGAVRDVAGQSTIVAAEAVTCASALGQ